MLFRSKAAANALLKTLEEPPPGLLFVLATTEPEKLPPTILSRCQHFRFRRLTDIEIHGKLSRLCAEAGVEAEEKALALVARAADGGMRDAESLLDRLLVTGATITAAMAEDALGLPPQDRLVAMGQALLADDLADLLEQAGQLYRSGYAPRTVAEQLTRSLRDRLQAVLEPGSHGTDGQVAQPDEKDALLRLIHALDDEHDRFSRRNDLYSLEVALIKAGNTLRFPAGEPVSVERQPQQPRTQDQPRTHVQQRDTGTPSPSGDAGVRTPAGAAPTEPEAGPEQGAPEVPPEPEAPTETPVHGTEPTASRQFSWHAIKSAAGPQLKAFLQPAHGSNEGSALRLEYEDRYKFHYEQLLKRRDELKDLIGSVAGGGYTLEVVGPGRATGALPVGPEGGGPKKA